MIHHNYYKQRNVKHCNRGYHCKYSKPIVVLSLRLCTLT